MSKFSRQPSQYLGRIEHVARTKPDLLIAYASSMFLAALAGGQILGAIVKRTLGAIFDFHGAVWDDTGKTDYVCLLRCDTMGEINWY